MDWAGAKSCPLRLHEPTTTSNDVIISSDFFVNVAVGDLLRIAPLLNNPVKEPTTGPTPFPNPSALLPHPGYTSTPVQAELGTGPFGGKSPHPTLPGNLGASNGGPRFGSTPSGTYGNGSFLKTGTHPLRPNNNSRRSSHYGQEWSGAVDIDHEVILQVNEVDHGRVSKNSPLSVATTLAAQFKLSAMATVLVQKIDPTLVTASYVELQIRNAYIDRAEILRFQTQLHHKVLYQSQSIAYLQCFTAEVRMVKSSQKPVKMAYVTPQTRVVVRTSSARYIVFIQFSREIWQFLEDGTMYYERAIQQFLSDLFRHWRKRQAKHFVTLVLFSRLIYTDEQHEWINDLIWHPELRCWYKDFYKVIADMELCTLLCDSPDSAALLVKKDFIDFNWEIMQSYQLHHPPPEPHALGYRGLVGQHALAMHGNVLEAINLAMNTFDRRNCTRDTLRTKSKIVMVTPSTGVFDVGKALLRMTTERMVDLNLRMDLVCLAPKPLHKAPVFRSRSMVPPSWNRSMLHGDASKSDYAKYQSSYFSQGLSGTSDTSHPDESSGGKLGGGHLGLALDATLNHFGRSHSPGSAETPLGKRRTADEPVVDILYYDDPVVGPDDTSTTASPSYFASHGIDPGTQLFMPSPLVPADPEAIPLSYSNRSPGVTNLPVLTTNGGAVPSDAEYWFYSVPFWVNTSFYAHDGPGTTSGCGHRFQPYCRMPAIQKAGTGKHLKVFWQVPYLLGDLEHIRDQMLAQLKPGMNNAGTHRSGSLVRRHRSTVPQSPLHTSRGDPAIGHDARLSRSQDKSSGEPASPPQLPEMHARSISNGGDRVSSGSGPAEGLSSSHKSQLRSGSLGPLLASKPPVPQGDRTYSHTSSQTGRGSERSNKFMLHSPLFQRQYSQAIFTSSSEHHDLYRPSDNSTNAPLVTRGERLHSPAQSGDNLVSGGGEYPLERTTRVGMPTVEHRVVRSEEEAPMVKSAGFTTTLHSCETSPGFHGSPGSYPRAGITKASMLGVRNQRIYHIEDALNQSHTTSPSVHNPHDPWYHYYAPIYAASLTPALCVFPGEISQVTGTTHATQLSLGHADHHNGGPVGQRQIQPRRLSSVSQRGPLEARGRFISQPSMLITDHPTCNGDPRESHTGVQSSGDAAHPSTLLIEEWASEQPVVVGSFVDQDTLDLPIKVSGSGGDATTNPAACGVRPRRSPAFRPQWGTSLRNRPVEFISGSSRAHLAVNNMLPKPSHRPALEQPPALTSPMIPTGPTSSAFTPTACRVYFIVPHKLGLLDRQYKRWDAVTDEQGTGESVLWKSLETPAHLPLTTESRPAHNQMAKSYKEYPTNFSPDPERLARTLGISTTVNVDCGQRISDDDKVRALLVDMVAARLNEGFQIVTPTQSSNTATPEVGVAHSEGIPSLENRRTHNTLDDSGISGKPPIHLPPGTHRSLSGYVGTTGPRRASSVYVPKEPLSRYNSGFDGLPMVNDIPNPLNAWPLSTSVLDVARGQDPDWDQLTTKTHTYVLSNGQDYHFITYNPHNHEVSTKRYIRTRTYRREPVPYRFNLWSKYDTGYIPRSITFRYSDKSDFQWNMCDQLIVDYSDALLKSAYVCIRLTLIPMEKVGTPINSTPTMKNARLTDEEQRIMGFQGFLDHFIRAQRRGEAPVGSNLAVRSHHTSSRSPGSGDHRSAAGQLGLVITTKRPSVYYHDRISHMSTMTHVGVTRNPSIRKPRTKRGKEDSSLVELTLQSSLAMIANALQHPDTGLCISLRRWHWRLYPHSFVGQAFVDWLLDQVKELDTRERAVQFAQQLFSRGLFYHCQGRPVFLDDMMIYQLHPDYIQAKPDSKPTWGTAGYSRRVFPELNDGDKHLARPDATSAVENSEGKSTKTENKDTKEDSEAFRSWMDQVVALALEEWQHMVHPMTPGAVNQRISLDVDNTGSPAEPGGQPLGLGNLPFKRHYGNLVGTSRSINVSMVGTDTSLPAARSRSGGFFFGHKPIPISMKDHKTMGGPLDSPNDGSSLLPHPTELGQSGPGLSLKSTGSDHSASRFAEVQIPRSSFITVDIDSNRKSDRSELALVEYDTVFVPGQCYHFSLFWLGCTSAVVADQITSWRRICQRSGFQLVQSPTRQLTDDELANQYPFLSTQEITLATLPDPDTLLTQVDITASGEITPLVDTADSFTGLRQELLANPAWLKYLPRYFFEEALLLRLNFVLDLEADEAFPQGVGYKSIYPLEFKYPQYIHRSGLAYVQIRGHGKLFWLDNFLHLATLATDQSRSNTLTTGALNASNTGVGNGPINTIHQAQVQPSFSRFGELGEDQDDLENEAFQEEGEGSASPYEQVHRIHRQFVATCHDAQQLGDIWLSALKAIVSPQGLNTLVNSLPGKLLYP
ncbi:vacuolar membrane-associated protein iml1 [Dispira simplex]|nr:vacuolar membrane-associated protein iml1 [Dispira simplex]